MATFDPARTLARWRWNHPLAKARKLPKVASSSSEQFKLVPNYLFSLKSWQTKEQTERAARAVNLPSGCKPAPPGAKATIMSELQHQLLITLVHGTWGRGFFPRRQKVAGRQECGTTSNGKELLPHQKRRPLWFEEGSPFLARLNAELNDISHKSTPLLWSGKNAIFERDKTAQVLAEYMSTEHLEHPKATQLIIAHSHGGNIALRALQHLQKLDVSKMDGAACTSPLVVTLATPFIEIHKAELGLRPLYVRIALVLLITLLAGALFSIVGDQIDKLSISKKSIPLDLEQYLAWSAWYRWRASLFMAVTVCSAGLVGLIASWWLLRHQAPVRRDRIHALNEATRLGEIPSAQARRLLIIRAINDEASLAMALGTIVNFATTWAIVITYATFVLLSISLFLINFKFLGDFGGVVSLKLLLAVISAAIVGLILLFGMLVISRVVHGRELAISPMECQINTQSAPDVVDLSKIVTLVSSTFVKSLRHGIYDHEDCPKTISDWVRLQLGTKS